MNDSHTSLLGRLRRRWWPQDSRSSGQEASTPRPADTTAHAAKNGTSAPASASTAAKEVVLRHVWTEAPNAFKLAVDRPLLEPGSEKHFRSAHAPQDASHLQGTADAAARPDFVAALFAQGGIESITVEPYAITVFMQEDADWDPLMQQALATLKTQFGERSPFIDRPTMTTSSAPTSSAPTPAAVGSSAKQGSKYRFRFRKLDAEKRSPEEQRGIVQRLLDEEINPAVAAHGGHFQLIDVRDDRVFVRLGGGCQGCGAADVTLRQGVEQRLRQALPEMIALVDVTDHAAGANPYYAPTPPA